MHRLAWLSPLLLAGGAMAAPPPQPVRIVGLDCAQGAIKVVYPQACERRTVGVGAEVCAHFAVGDRVVLGAYDVARRVRAAKRVGPTTEMRGRIIILDKQGGFIQISDACGANCNAKVPAADVGALKIEQDVALRGVFDWTKSCVVKQARARPLDPLAPR
jgi:hypothetical protein